MKLKNLFKIYSKWLVLSLAVINILLLAYYLKPAKLSSQTHPQLSDLTPWQIAEYPEIDPIKGSNWDFQKLAVFFKTLALKKGGEYAYHALSVAANHGYLTPNVDIHLLGHAVGDVLYKQKGIEGIKVCTDDLRNACSHSIVVGFLLDNGVEGLTKAVATCLEAPGGSGAYTMCVHGLGHGVLAYTDYDMRRAAELCGKTGTLKYGNQEVGQCIGGVTMEMMAGVHDREAWAKQAVNYFKKNDPLAPCDMGFIPKDSLNFCYIYLTPHLFEAAGANLSSPDPKYFNQAMSYCAKIPATDNNRETCYASFGKEYVVLANSRNVQSVTSMTNDQLKTVYDWCNLGPKEGLGPCVNSALQSLYWGGENDRAVSIKFCNAIPNQDESKNCFMNLTATVLYYQSDVGYRRSFCQELPAQFQEKCKSQLL